MRTKERTTLSVEEAARALGVARTVMYAAAGRGEFGAMRLGRRLVIPLAPLAEKLGLSETEVLARLEDEPDAAA
jgi:excisionase family DNA binding protein